MADLPSSLLHLPLELITAEIVPLLSFSSLLSLLATSKEFYGKINQTIRWLDWFTNSVRSAQNLQRSIDTQQNICEWAYRGIALEQLYANIESLSPSMDSITMTTIYTTFRLHYSLPDRWSHWIPLLIERVDTLYRRWRTPSAYDHSNSNHLLWANDIFLVHTKAFDYVRNFVWLLNNMKYEDILSNKRERRLFGNYISRFIPRHGEYNPAANVLGQYLMENVDMDDLMAIINTPAPTSLLKRFRTLVARYLYEKYRDSYAMELYKTNRVLAVLQLDHWPLYCHPTTIKTILTMLGLYCGKRCCIHRPPRRDTLLEIYLQSPHQMKVNYDDWLDLAIELILRDKIR